MRVKFNTVLYMAAALCAIAALVVFLVPLGGDGGGEATDPQERARLAELREGDMKKLVLHTAAKPVSDAAFTHEDGREATLAEYRGKVVLLNFWATWCAPCRKEMPMLSTLQSELGGEDFEVVTLATGRNPLPAIETFFAEIGVDNLPLHRDPDQKIARDMGVLGLPITVILDREGREIARLQGDAHWNSGSARAILRTIIDGAGRV